MMLFFIIGAAAIHDQFVNAESVPKTAVESLTG